MRSLRASFLVLALVAVGCGRGGLGDFEVNGETSIEEDTATETAVIDTAVLPDTPNPPPDTWVDWDSDPPPDTWVEWDSEPPPPDTWVGWDTTPPPDTWIDFDTTPPPDTWVGWDTTPPPDTWVTDTWMPDTIVPDTSVFDTSVDGGPPEGGILCGGDYCDSASEQCCASFGGVSCVAKGACTGGTTLDCSSSASCGFGEVCCFGGLGGGTPTATCQLFCAGIQLCATSAECGPMRTCQPTFGGYRICR